MSINTKFLTLAAILLTSLSGALESSYAQEALVKVGEDTEIKVENMYFFSNDGTGGNLNPYDGFEAKKGGIVKKTYKFNSIKRINVEYVSGEYEAEVIFDNGETEKCTDANVHYLMGKDERGNEVEISTREVGEISVILKE